METEAQIRNNLVRKILEIPVRKLKPLSDFILKIENNNKKADILFFSGVWNDIDDSVFQDLTENLIQNRKSNRRSPIDEYFN